MLLHRYYIQNGTVKDVAEYQPNAGIEIYEVIRVMKRVPLFLEDHLQRFFHSAWLCHLEIPLDAEIISAWLKRLIEVNGIGEGNIRFSYCFRPEGNFQAYFIPHHYPSEEEIRQGVACGILHAERMDPNAKVVQANLREMANRMIEEKGYYEVLLVNQQSAFTEGSRSNLFFVMDGNFVTSPAKEVLPGITRKKVMDLLTNLGRKVEKRSLPLSELPAVEAAFLSGTSPRVLPISKIENFTLKSNLPEVRELIEKYDQMIMDYIKNRM